MTYLSSLVNSLTPLVLDTSVLINLHASRCGARILDALPNPIIVPEIVAAELKHETSKTKGEQQFIQDLVATSKVRLVVLNKPEYRSFGRLVSGSRSLGDGEAATIVIAVCRRLFPIIDERRGRQQAQAHLSGEHPRWSLDLFRHPSVVADLGAREAVDSLYFALRDGRMRIHEAHCDQVVSLIGVQRALECSSLPRYKVRRNKWQVSIDAEVGCRSA